MIRSNIVTSVHIRLCSDNILLTIVILKGFPECFRILTLLIFIVRKEVIWASIEEANRIKVLSCIEVPVVSDILGNCLLKDSSPEGIVGADLSEKTVTVASERKVIVDVCCIGDTECVNIHSINTLLTHFSIMKDFFDSLWIFGKPTEGSEDQQLPMLP